MGWCGGMAWWEGGRERGQGRAMEWTEHVCVCMCVCAICVCWGGGVLFQQSPLKHEPFTCVLTHVSTYMCTIAQLISKDHKSCACLCVCVHFQACKCTEFRHTGFTWMCSVPPACAHICSPLAETEHSVPKRVRDGYMAP